MQKGSHQTEEAKRKISAANIGKKKTEAQKHRLREVNTGLTKSEATKAKMRASQQVRRAREKGVDTPNTCPPTK
jgi:hypothetical protein